VREKRRKMGVRGERENKMNENRFFWFRFLCIEKWVTACLGKKRAHNSNTWDI